MKIHYKQTYIHLTINTQVLVYSVGRKERCIKIAPKLHHCCMKIAPTLHISCIRIASKLYQNQQYETIAYSDQQSIPFSLCTVLSHWFFKIYDEYMKKRKKKAA